MSNKLKLVTTTDSGTEANVPFIIKNGDEHVIYDGETPALAYYKDGQTFYALDKGGSEVRFISLNILISSSPIDTRK